MEGVDTQGFGTQHSQLPSERWLSVRIQLFIQPQLITVARASVCLSAVGRESLTLPSSARSARLLQDLSQDEQRRPAAFVLSVSRPRSLAGCGKRCAGSDDSRRAAAVLDCRLVHYSLRTIVRFKSSWRYG